MASSGKPPVTVTKLRHNDQGGEIEIRDTAQSPQRRHRVRILLPRERTLAEQGSCSLETSPTRKERLFLRAPEQGEIDPSGERHYAQVRGLVAFDNRLDHPWR